MKNFRTATLRGGVCLGALCTAALFSGVLNAGTDESGSRADVARPNVREALPPPSGPRDAGVTGEQLLPPLSRYRQLYNGEEIRPGEIDLMEEYSILVDAERELIAIFDSEDLLVDWARSNGLEAIADASQCLDDTAAYAEERGLIALFEKTGSIPEEEYEYLTKACASGKAPSALSGFGRYWFGNWFNGGAIPSITYPFFPNNWNNNISSYDVIGVYSVFCDRSFFRGPRFWVWHIAINFSASFNGLWINNRTSSTLAG